MTEETIVELPLDKIHDSPTQPRKKYSQAEIAEMAETMKPPGRVHQPIVVRDHPSVAGEWERVFGHKRSRAAALAGRDTIPAVVRHMTDEEVEVAQLVENLQRSDVTPLDEADAFDNLRREHGASIEDLMVKSGKGRTYVYNRLRLATSHDDIREQVIEGGLDAELAQEIARLPNPLQPIALRAIGHMSYRAAVEELRRRFQYKLHSAPFDVLDIKLVPEAGGCDACTKRSDREPVLLEECGPDVCMDGACYAKKAEAARTLATALARETDPIARAAQTSKAKKGQAQAQQGGLNFGRDEDDAGETDGSSQAGADAHQIAAAHTRSRYADLAPPMRAVSDPDLWLAVREKVFDAALAAPRSVEDLRLLVFRELQLMGRIDDPILAAMGWLQELDEAVDQDELVRHKLATATADQLAAILVLIAIVDTEGSERLDVAQRYGVDPVEAAGLVHKPDEVQIDVEEVASPPATAGKKTSAKYRCSQTGSTWSGKGMKPKWLTVALANGKTLADFAV